MDPKGVFSETEIAKTTSTRSQSLESKVRERDGFGCARIHYAAAEGDAEQVLLLLQARADPNKRDNESRTPIDLATEEKHRNVVDELLVAKEAWDKRKNKGFMKRWISCCS